MQLLLTNLTQARNKQKFDVNTGGFLYFSIKVH